MTEAQQHTEVYPWDVVTDMCPCGHGVGHEKVVVERRIGFWMEVAAFLGVTPVPYEVVFHCRSCGRDFARTRDLSVRNFYAQ